MGPLTICDLLDITDGLQTLLNLSESCREVRCIIIDSTSFLSLLAYVLGALWLEATAPALNAGLAALESILVDKGNKKKPILNETQVTTRCVDVQLSDQ